MASAVLLLGFMQLRHLALAVAVLGCDGGGTTPDEPDAGVEPPPPDAWVDQAGPLFAPAHVVEVDIELAAADWDLLRDQTRSITDLLSTCQAGPFPDPFTYFHADVTVDGQPVTDVGLRKKGFLGSMDTERPSLKLKLDEYVDDQRLYGRKTLTLNNVKQDAAVIRSCLSYQVFAAAGLRAPRCNFAHVTVNGHDLGVYVNVEAINKDFLRGNFADPEGNLYEGTLSDFRPGWTGTFELKTNESTGSLSDLDALTTALEAPDNQLLARLGEVIDVDRFIRFWAAEILVTHWDGFASNTNNFFTYHDPVSGRFELLPWGPDMSFVSTGSPFNLFSPISVQAQSILARRLYLLPSTRARYVAAMQALLAEVWDETALLAEVDRMEALIAPIAGRDLTADIEQVRVFIRNRRAQILAELTPTPPAWTTPLRNPLCLESMGQVAGSFSTTWGTEGSLFPFTTGTGTMTATLDGNPLDVSEVGATSGMPALALEPTAQITVFARLDDGAVEQLVISVDEPERRFHPGADLALDWTHVNGLLWHTAPWQIPYIVGLVSNGTLHLSSASTGAGATITGTFSGEVLRLVL